MQSRKGQSALRGLELGRSESQTLLHKRETHGILSGGDVALGLHLSMDPAQKYDLDGLQGLG